MQKDRFSIELRIAAIDRLEACYARNPKTRERLRVVGGATMGIQIMESLILDELEAFHQELRSFNLSDVES